MLRMMFGEQPREWSGPALQTVTSIQRFVKLTATNAERFPGQSGVWIKYGIWAEGLLRALDELEQSCYASRRFAEKISHGHLDELTPEEQRDYDRHVYFDKSGYIRIFALLDKLGTLLNQLLGLETERIKAYFSYFTVLRNLRENKLYPELTAPLNELKERYQAPMNRLRNRRNIEVHQMNAELQDDLRQGLEHKGERRLLENLQPNIYDLDQGWEMTRDSLAIAFAFTCDWLNRKK